MGFRVYGGSGSREFLWLWGLKGFMPEATADDPGEGFWTVGKTELALRSACKHSEQE